MNVLFHTTAAVGIVIALTDTKTLDEVKANKRIYLIGAASFFLGIIVHGALDYIPHCYPLKSKPDILFSLLIIASVIWFCQKKYRSIFALSFLGNIFPDLVDLAPNILNQQFGWLLPTTQKIFPWHQLEHSGSIYGESCANSNLNHLLFLLGVALIIAARWKDVHVIFRKMDK
jgi:hypothetical protein